MPSDVHRFAPEILRAYDVRGVVGESLGEADAQALGRAFATVLRETAHAPTVCVGRDGRPTSPALEAALVDGLRAAGACVPRVGLGPTPMLYFAAHTLGADGGVMVTGSHNPPTHNGFKFVTRAGAFYGEDIQRLGALAAAGAFASGAGAAGERDVTDDYVDALAAAWRSERELRVAWDAGKRRRRPRYGAPRRAPAGLPCPAVRDGGRDLPRTPSRPDRAGEPRSPCRHGARRRLRPRRRLRRRRRPPRRGGRQGAVSSPATASFACSAARCSRRIPAPR